MNKLFSLPPAIDEKAKKIKLVILFISAILVFISCTKDNDTVSPQSEIFGEMVSSIENQQYGDVHSLLILKDNKIIFEKYFNNYSRNSKHALYSITKSFTSALIGICLAKGYIENIEMEVMDFFPEYESTIANYDSLKAKITIKNLLTMTSGLSWDEWATSYNDPDNDVMELVRSNDWIKYVLDKPMSHAPGTYIYYNSGGSHVLSGIITKATGQSAEEFARDNLFSFLDITDWNWEKRSDGISIGGWGLSLRPVDMIKFGQLYLNKGVWNNVQVIPESWIEESTMPHYKMNQWVDYGYQWWRSGNSTESENSNIFFASGRGEQYIWVIPDHNAVAVCTAWNDGESKLDAILWEYILKALDN